jgi:hypothetical protein
VLARGALVARAPRQRGAKPRQQAPLTELILRVLFRALLRSLTLGLGASSVIASCS